MSKEGRSITLTNRKGRTSMLLHQIGNEWNILFRDNYTAWHKHWKEGQKTENNKIFWRHTVKIQREKGWDPRMWCGQQHLNERRAETLHRPYMLLPPGKQLISNRWPRKTWKIVGTLILKAYLVCTEMLLGCIYTSM